MFASSAYQFGENFGENWRALMIRALSGMRCAVSIRKSSMAWNLAFIHIDFPGRMPAAIAFRMPFQHDATRSPASARPLHWFESLLA